MNSAYHNYKAFSRNDKLTVSLTTFLDYFTKLLYEILKEIPKRPNRPDFCCHLPLSLDLFTTIP